MIENSYLKLYIGNYIDLYKDTFSGICFLQKFLLNIKKNSLTTLTLGNKIKLEVRKRVS